MTPTPTRPRPLVTRVELDLGSGQVRRGALLGASALVQQHGPQGWVPLPDTAVQVTFTPVGSGEPMTRLTRTDERGRARFGARHEVSGTWSVVVAPTDAAPSTAARLVVVRD